MKKLGKKTKAWIVARAILIKEAVKDGRIVIVYGKVMGLCEDCGRYLELDPDHRLKRSQGGSHDKVNISWVCQECHDKRDNKGDPMKKKITTTKKANWQLPHPCKKCKRITSMLICNHCGNLST